MSRALKPLVALAAALALLALTATPGAATTGTVTGGTFIVNFTPASFSDLVPGGTGACGSAANTTLDIVMATTGTGTATLDVETSRASISGLAVGFIHLSGTGSVTISGSTITIGSFAITGNVYPETTPGSCVPDLTAPRCFGGVLANNLTLGGTWSGSVTPPALSGTATVTGSSPITAFGCIPPYSALNGHTMTISNMTTVF